MRDRTDERLAELADGAREVLEKLCMAGLQGPNNALADELIRPRPGDYQRVFIPAMAEALQRAYEPFWIRRQMGPRPKPTQSQVRLSIATTEDLRAGNDRAHPFPEGYQKVARYFVPGRVWIRWKFVEPGATMGMAYDGLVWIDDHWAWFPKPWKAVNMARTMPPEPYEA